MFKKKKRFFVQFGCFALLSALYSAIHRSRGTSILNKEAVVERLRKRIVIVAAGSA
jgi:hypothetical protein